jgi:signal transduction histidine kinase
LALATALVAAAQSPAPTPPASGTPQVAPLTTAAQVLRLAPEQAQASPPVRIRGVVTYYEPGQLLFVQDETAGIFVYHTSNRLSLQPGQGVVVTGLAEQGRYSPIIASPTFELLSTAPTVRPESVSLSQVYLGGLDAQWVELTGVVRTERVVDGRLRVEVADPPHRLSVWIPSFDGYEHQPLAGALVRVRGVVGVGVNARQQAEGFQLFANTLADIQVLRPPPADPFSAPLWRMRDLRGSAARTGLTGCVRVRGVATLQSGHTLFLQDSTGGVEVETETPMEEVSLGQAVEAVGYLGPVLEAPQLEDAVLHKLQTNAPPPAARPTPEELFQGLHHAELVEVEAQFLGLANSSSNRLTLALEADNHLLTAQVQALGAEGALRALKPGSRVQLRGVCRSQRSSGTEPKVALLLSSAADLKVVAPPAGTAGLGMPALAAAALLTSAGLAWALWFIQKQRRRTASLLQSQVTLQAEMSQGEEQLRRSLEERERIARDLHDDIIQSIYAVGLNLEDCRRVVSRSPAQVEPRLASAIENLNKTIRSVRSFIAGLEPKVLNGREFKTALKSLALTSGESAAQFQLEVDATAANGLTSGQATQLLHIAKEAMSNSLRHAQASNITVSLLPVPAGVCLEIRDDGSGFEPEAPKHTGQGLRNMNARARDIGAELKIVSAPEQGCRIIVVVPQRNPHEPN